MVKDNKSGRYFKCLCITTIIPNIFTFNVTTYTPNFYICYIIIIIIIIIIGIQPLGRFGQRPELSQSTGIALVRCILSKFLGIVCHCYILTMK